MMSHLVDGDRSRVRLSQHHHTQGISDQYQVEAHAIQEAAHRIVVGGEGGKFVIGRLLFGKILS